MSSIPRKRTEPRVEAELDEALDDTFPASDPVAMTEPSTPIATPIATPVAAMPTGHHPEDAGPPPAPPAERDLGRDERIRRRAYEIWAREGHPAGREVEHWAEAERAIDAEDAAKRGPAADLPDSARALATGRA